MNIRLLLPLGLFLGMGVFLFLGLGKDPSVVPSPLLGKPAPEFDLPQLHDPAQRVSKQALLGQTYVLNVWASWCPGCRVEHDLVAALAQSGKVPVYGLNWKDEPQDAKRWLAQFGDPYAGIAADYDGKVAIDFGVYGAPETFVVNSDGLVIFKHIGPLTQDIINTQLLPLVEGS